MKLWQDPDVKASGMFAAINTFLSSLNMWLATVGLALNAGFIAWKWNEARKLKNKSKLLDDEG